MNRSRAFLHNKYWMCIYFIAYNNAIVWRLVRLFVRACTLDWDTQYLINIILSECWIIIFRVHCTQINDKLNSLWHRPWFFCSYMLLLIVVFDVCAFFFLLLLLFSIFFFCKLCHCFFFVRSAWLHLFGWMLHRVYRRLVDCHWKSVWLYACRNIRSYNDISFLLTMSTTLSPKPFFNIIENHASPLFHVQTPVHFHYQQSSFRRL